MSEWYIRLSCKIGNFLEFLKELNKLNLINTVTLTDESTTPHTSYDKNIKDLSSEEETEDLILDWAGWTSVFDKNKDKRTVSITFITNNEGFIDSFEDRMKVIEIADEMLKPYSFEAIDEDRGSTPVFEGKWDINFFKEKVVDEIEYGRKKSDE